VTKHKTVRVAIIGVGNCASALVQGIHFYNQAAEDEFIPGLMHNNLGGYRVRDIEFSAAFDVVDTKVGWTCPKPSSPTPTIPSASPRYPI
jgi:myo-inositol-1-phosphate synthase